MNWAVKKALFDNRHFMSVRCIITSTCIMVVKFHIYWINERWIFQVSDSEEEQTGDGEELEKALREKALQSMKRGISRESPQEDSSD